MIILPHTAHIVDNRSLIEEEKNGFGTQYVASHQTTITDPEVRNTIAKLSVAEIIS